MTASLRFALLAAVIVTGITACDRIGGGRPEAGRDVPSIANALEEDNSGKPGATRVDSELSSTDPATLAPVDEVYPGTARGAGRVAETAPRPVGTLSVSFDGAGLEQALKVIIGDQLGLSYVLPPDLTGRVTLRTARPLTRGQMTVLLEGLLASHGLSAVYEGDLVRVVRGAAGSEGGTGIGLAGGPGSGAEVFSLSYVSATQMVRLLEPFVRAGRVLPVGLADDLVLVSGPATERRAAERAIGLLDVDRLAGRSVAIIGLANASVEAVIPELNELFSAGGEGANGIVRFTPIDRLNAILVIAADEAQVVRARTWIKRLDRTRNADERRLFVYFVKHGEATSLVKTLEGAFKDDGFLGGPVPDKNAAGVEGGSGAERLRSSGPRFNADGSSNAILVWATGREYELISEVLAKLDITPLQVLIEGTVLEVSLQDDLRYGLQYFIETGEFSTIFTRGTNANTVSPLTPGFGISIGGPNSSKIVIDALSELTDVRVVSSPQLLVLDGGTARLHVGDQVPIVTRTSSATVTDDNRIVNEIEYRDTGVTLNVTPKVKASGVVTLEVSQEVSDVVRTDSSDIDSPTIQQRRVVSTAAVESGTTVLLAGLIREIQNDVKSGIPVLHQLPVVGDLFGTTDKSTQRTELVVLITPRVIRNREEATDATRTLLRQYRGLIDQFRAPDSSDPVPPRQ
ncbi:type II secretion system secretin GspD [Nisaea sediminum]|uniref:type II secretion system secretin GspD n=1 Tax=Nisaea sediminum TaxID=2775867 RepID=UPI001867C8FC|nr:type II secretion system secretin GspD [Nisaea sediminum]